jgi:dihydrofolate reductase
VRKVVLYELASLDGVVEAPDRFVFDFDEVMYDNLAQVLGAQDTVLLGRVTYDYWAPYWPTATDEPFASFINSVEKLVVTSTPLEPEWNRASRLEPPFEQAVRALKEQPGSDIGVHGSITLAQTLLRLGLADELRLVVAPVAAGAGRRLFDEFNDVTRFELLRSVSTPSGALLVDYRVKGPA